MLREDGVFRIVIYNYIMDISKVTLNIDNLLGTSANKITHLAQAEGCLIYPSGNFIIFYSPILDEQVAYLTHTSQYISSIVVSPDEKLLAVCQNAKHGSATIYPINNLQTLKGGIVKQAWTLRGHKFGIDHLVFSPNSQYIVSVSNQDGSMFLWQNGEAATKNRISKSISKVIFDGKGDLLTIGRGYLKLWPFLNGNPIKKMQNEQAMLEGKVMSFGKKFSTQDFIDGRVVSIEQSDKLVLLSSQGLICIISAGYQKIQKWIDVMMQGVSALQLVDSIVICCGDHALVKAVDLQALEFKGKFPKPPPTNRQNLTEQQPLQYMQNDEFPRCLGAKKVGRFVVTLYSNRTIFVWKLQGLNDIQAVRSILSHRGRVNSLAILQQVSGGELVFLASAAEDHTLRLWHYYGKQGSEARRASDVGKMLDLRRNIYCKYLTHIIYTHSEHPITQIKSFKKTKIVCIARNEVIIYSIQNFGLFLIQSFQEARLTALQTSAQLIFLGNQHKKVMVFYLLEDKLEKKRQILFQPGVERILSSGNRLLINGKTNTRLYSLEGQLLKSFSNSQKICVTGNYLLSCNNKILDITNLTKSSSRASSVSLNHEMDEDEVVSLIKSNSWLIVVITNKNRLILINFSATVLYSELIYQTVTDVEITQQGKIIMSGQSGVLFVKNQSTTMKYKQIDQKVKKWFENNDMSWMDGSVWASKNKSHTNSAQISQQLPSNRQSLRHKISQELGPCQESIRLGEGGWADLSVSLKQPQAFNGAISYKNEDNKRSIFNPSSIVAQVNKIYKEVDQLQKGDKQRPPMADKTQKSRQDNSSFLQQKSLLGLSKGKKRIFGSKQKQEYYPKFTNNLVQSIIDEAESAHQKVTTQTQQHPSTSKQQQLQSVDFSLSNFDEGHHSKISQGPVLQYTRTKSPSIPHQEFLDSVKDLMGVIDNNQNDYQNIVSMVCQHSQQYYKLYKVLDRVFEQREKKNRKQNMLKHMDSLWTEMRSKLQKQF